MTPSRSFTCRPRAKCHPGDDDGHDLAVYRQWRPNGRLKERAPTKECGNGQDLSGLLGQAGPTRNPLPELRRRLGRQRHRPEHRGRAAGEAVRNTAAAAHLSTFAGLVIPFGSVIGPLAVWLTRRHRDPFIDQAGREALNFGISIAIYGSVLLVAALMLVGIPLLMVGVVAWVVLASLAAVKASQGQAYRYPLTLRLVR
jgi:uncharacterized protein